jgi:regulator of sirC expression with transglutaminase-like and TPR domain
MKIENWHEGATFCGKILDLNPAEYKALYRRGTCRRNICDYQGAQSDLRSAMEILQEKTDATSKACLRDVIIEINLIKKICQDVQAKEKEMYKNVLK